MVSRNDLGPENRPRLPEIQAQFDPMPTPKERVVRDDSAHGQRIFDTPASTQITRLVLRLLRSP